MKKQTLILSALLVLSPITYAKTEFQPNTHQISPVEVDLNNLTKEQNRVYDTVVQYQTALNSGDTKTILELFAPESYSQWNGKRTADTTEKRFNQYSNLFQNEKFETDFAFDSINVKGDSAYVRTHHHRGAVVTELDNQHTLIDLNREIFVMRKVNGEWKIAVYAFNTDPVQGES